MNDTDLVRAAQKGDSKAYLALFQKFEKQLYRTAFCYVQNEHDALDIVQDTAYKSFKTISGLKEPGFFQTWLVRICIRCAIDTLRKNKKTLLLDGACQTAQKESVQDTNLVFLSMLAQLKEMEKSVIILKYYHDFTYKMISQTLNIPEGTAKSHHHAAIKKLRLDLAQSTDCTQGGFCK